MQVKNGGLYEMRGSGRVRIVKSWGGCFSCVQAEPWIRWNNAGEAYCMVKDIKDVLTKGRRKALERGDMDLIYEVDESVWIPFCKDAIISLLDTEISDEPVVVRKKGRHWQVRVSRDEAREIAEERNSEAEQRKNYEFLGDLDLWLYLLGVQKLA